MEEEDFMKSKKGILSVCKGVVVGVVLGVVLNVQFKKIPKINFLTWNKYARWGFRVPLFFIPYLVLCHHNTNKNFAFFDSLH